MKKSLERGLHYDKAKLAAVYVLPEIEGVGGLQVHADYRHTREQEIDLALVDFGKNLKILCGKIPEPEKLIEAINQLSARTAFAYKKFGHSVYNEEMQKANLPCSRGDAELLYRDLSEGFDRLAELPKQDYPLSQSDFIQTVLKEAVQASPRKWIPTFRAVGKVEFKPTGSKEFPWAAEFKLSDYPSLNPKFVETQQWFQSSILTGWYHDRGYGSDITKGERVGYILETDELNDKGKISLAHEVAQSLSYSGYLGSSSIPIAPDILRAAFGKDWKKTIEECGFLRMALMGTIPNKNGLKEIEGLDAPAVPTNVISEPKKMDEIVKRQQDGMTPP
jgi:hypothetical protein